MKKWTLLDRALTPDGKALTLHEHDGNYTIRVDGADLMSTRQHTSEEKLAELACAGLRERRGARVLVGGLGFGYTAKAALAAVGPDARVVIAELMEPVILWNRNPAYPLAASTLADPRVEVVSGDVADVLRARAGAFDAILLDVDNGPAALSSPRNAPLYGETGLAAVHSALRPAGCVGYWSAVEDPAFEKRMRKAGFAVEVESARSHRTGGSRHTLFLGRRR